MNHKFDTEVDRQDSNSVKWEFIQSSENHLGLEQTNRSFGENRVLPMWVADMDFTSPEPVVDALTARAQHGIFGYAAPTQAFYQSVIHWMKRRHQWEILPEWICITPGVVPALNMLVRALTSSGDQVLIQPPVYYPFYGAIENNGADLVLNPLIYDNNQYRMDFEDLEIKCRDPKVKMAILCSPHNPGRACLDPGRAYPIWRDMFKQ